MSENALAKVEDFNFPVLGDDLGEVMSEEMEGLSIEFDRVKIPSGGGLAFEIPGDDPENPDVVKELVGVIVDHHPVNAYWADKYSGQNNPPDCSSLDGKSGTGNPGGDCKTCPYNQWGSDAETGGKACKNMHRIYLLRKGEMFPLMLTLPPTSIKPFSNYLAKRVIGRGRRSYGVITKITLKRETNKGGISYSQAQFAVAGELSRISGEAQRAAEYAAGIKSITRSIGVETTDYYQAPTENAEDDEVPF